MFKSLVRTAAVAATLSCSAAAWAGCGLTITFDNDTSRDKPLLPLVVLPLAPPHDAEPPLNGQPAARVDTGPLPPTHTHQQTAGILGCGRTLAYTLARRGEFPCQVLRLGNRYVIPTAALLRAREEANAR